VLAWAALNAGLALLLTLWWQDVLANGLFWAAVAVILLLALLAWRPRDRPRVVPDVSVAIVILAFGLAGLIAGSTFGDWNTYLSGFVTAIGLAALARELVVQRRRR
jgi:ABC-type Mn2+/Zn2+ transport system permease subunit